MTKKIIVFFVFVFFAWLGAGNRVVHRGGAGGGGGPTPDLLWWKMNASGATLTADVGPNGTTDGTQSGGSVLLDGAAQASSSSSLTYGIKTISMSFWLNSSTWSSGSARVIATNQYGAGGGGSWHIYEQFGTLNVVLYDSGGGREEQFTVSGLSTGAWHHFVIVLDNSTVSGDIKAYVDGSAQTPAFTSDGKAGNNNLLNGTLYIGIVGETVDDARVYSTELSGADATAIYGAGRQ
ncbi:LamG-like jellyroll fold domain-containing protein [Horticoccus sp. 23ND18S-11]|uniref:LamG-like jellyroll fold domain-containing protein n=1 Tax=Horticoccus sp. 23ND18S-11 TaxID=3391832 RepID=UPI0039C9B4AD